MHKQWSYSAAWWEVQRWRVRNFQKFGSQGRVRLKESFAKTSSVSSKVCCWSRICGEQSFELPKYDLTCRSDQKGLSLTPVRFDIKRNLGWAGDLSGNTLFGGPTLTLKLRANYGSFCDFLNKDLLFSSLYIVYTCYMISRPN